MIRIVMKSEILCFGTGVAKMQIKLQSEWISGEVRGLMKRASYVIFGVLRILFSVWGSSVYYGIITWKLFQC